MPELPSPATRARYGLAGIAAIVAIVWLALAAYNGSFTSTIPVTVYADRAGLGLMPGSSVTLLGVKVGTISSVDPRAGGGAVLKVKIDQSAIGQIPANVQAYVDASTLFGPKSVRLQAPQAPDTRRIAADDIVQTVAVSPEFNDLYQQLGTVLNSIDVGKLNAALSAVAQALDGRGAELGAYASQLEHYVATVNASLPEIQTDISLGSAVARQYSANTPDLLALANNFSTTSTTLTTLRPNLGTFLVDLTRTTRDANDLVNRTGEPLVQAMALLRPTARVLGEFAPEFGCVLRGLNYDRKLVEAVAGNKMAAIQANLELLPAQASYKYPRDLPKNVSGLGPDCYGLPFVSASKKPSPHYLFDDGTRSVWTGSGDTLSLGNPPATLYDSLFGETLSQLLGGIGGTQ